MKIAVTYRYIVYLFLILSISASRTITQDLFGNKTSYSTENAPLNLFCADFDNDGDVDIAVSNRYSRSVSILMNNGSGDFQTAVSYDAGTGPRGLSGADIDNDNDIDLAIPNWEADSISILKNYGDGTFDIPTNYSVGNSPHWVQFSNFDSTDTGIDLVVVNAQSNSVSILLNNGDGSFTSSTNHSVGSFPHAVYCADLDSDDNMDLAVCNVNSNSVSVLLNNGDATFASAVNYGTQSKPYAVFASDFNLDDNIDIVTTNRDANSVSILINDGNGTFGSAVNYATGSLPYYFYCDDLDLDGDNDVAVANRSSSNVTVLLNKGDGTFESPDSYAVGCEAHAVYCADFDADGDPDMAVTRKSCDSLSVYFNLTYQTFVISNLHDSGSGSFRRAIEEANSQPGRDTITFDISGTISLTSPLTMLTDDSTVILGSSAPGGAHSVVIDGSALSSGSGLTIQSSNNTIEGLAITGFPDNGISVEGATSVGNTLTNNLISNNGGLAIDLGNDGVTVNDAGDTDTGPNELLNYPEVDSVMSIMDETYMIYGRAAADAVVEFYAAHPAGDSSRPADPSGFGEAWEYIGQTTASPTGEFIFNDAVSDHFTILSATATDASGNTSEMSFNYTLYPRPLIVVAYVYDPAKGTYLPQNGVNIIVEDSTGAQFGRDSLNNPIDDIPGDQYYAEGPSEDTAIIPDPIKGEYTIYIVGESGSETGTCYGLIIKTDGLQHCILVIGAETPLSGTADSYGYEYDEDGLYINGDANGDDACNVSDAVYVINYVFKGGPQPQPEASGDANCDTVLNVSDAVYIINYVFKGGPAPCQIE